jgi:hypothetical protein
VVESWYGRAPWPYQTRRALRLLRIAHVRWLRPSYSSAADMIALGRQLADRRAPILNLLFHSSEAIAGGSPYNRTEADLDAFFDRLGRFLTFATDELGAEPMTFADFRQRHVQAARRPAAAATARDRGACASATSPRICRRIRQPTRCCRPSSASGRAWPAAK